MSMIVTVAAIEWRYDMETSRSLRLIAHGCVAGILGSVAFATGSLLWLLPTILFDIGTGRLLFAGLMVVIGGPLSLFYLWPVIRNEDQRPSTEAFTGDIEFPLTPRSTVIATMSGAIGLWGSILLGIPYDIIFISVMILVCSPVLVVLFSTHGRIEDNQFRCNGTEISIAQITGVYRISLGAVVLCWVSYARGTGILVPRLVTIPQDVADDVITEFERATEVSAERPTRNPAVQLVLSSAGVLFLGATLAAFWVIDDWFLRLYVGGVAGLIGVLFCVTAWRGI